MKQKTFRVLLTLTILSLSLSCSDLGVNPSDRTGTNGFGVASTIPPPTGGPINLANWNIKCGNLVTYNNTQFGQYVGSVFNTHNYISLGRFTKDNVTSLNADFNIPGLDVNAFSSQIAANAIVVTDDGTPINIASQYPGVTTYLNTTQLNILNTYFNDMLDTPNSIAAGTDYDYAVFTTNTSSLTRNQKINVLAILSYAHSFVMTNVGTGTNPIEIAISVQTGLPNQSAGCDIRWRDVWRSAVGSGFMGLLTGAWVGATAGTFAVPILGTVAGGVNGAVFGFAAGFASGAVGAVASQYFWNCLFKSPTMAPNSPCLDIAFFAANTDYCYSSPVNDIRWYIR